MFPRNSIWLRSFRFKPQNTLRYPCVFSLQSVVCSQQSTVYSLLSSVLLCSIISIKHLHCFGHMMLIIFAAWPKRDCNFAIDEMQFECNHLSDSVCLTVDLSICLSATQLAPFFIFLHLFFVFSFLLQLKIDRILWLPQPKQILMLGEDRGSGIGDRRSHGAGHKTIDYSPPGRKRNQTNSIYGNLHAASFRVD